MLRFIERALAEYEVVLQPDRQVAEWWAGAPSVVRAADGTFYMAARLRDADSPKGKRGYEIRILRGSDGVHFEPVGHIAREAAGVPGFQRPALLRDPRSGLYRLYCCAWLDEGWSVLKFDDAPSPEQFVPATARPVLQADWEDDDTIQVNGYKDPVILWTQGCWHMFVIGLDRVERIHHFVSDCGEKWTQEGPVPVFENTGWHNMFTRPASVVPMSVGYLFVYEGSKLGWFDPNYNICTGLAFTPDLVTFYDLTPNAPLLTSTTPGHFHNTWRYSSWMRVGDEMFVYFEAACANRTNEIRLARFPATDALTLAV
ncbi:MAG: hypothetical protein IT365_14195 [Candidatus Hydrogenedentes bacterium]|nr:hypothetical protein [Candidatus Hydrogenedentota bacterium]